MLRRQGYPVIREVPSESDHRFALCRPGLGLVADRLGAGRPIVWNLALEDAGDIFADGPVAAVGLDQDPLEQVVGQVDGPAFDAPGRSCIDGPGLPRRRPPAPR
jgi:hypothetical protein